MNKEQHTNICIYDKEELIILQLRQTKGISKDIG
jgi:hypothetical protein